jgi:hypothetical protein
MARFLYYGCWSYWVLRIEAGSVQREFYIGGNSIRIGLVQNHEIQLQFYIPNSTLNL